MRHDPHGVMLFAAGFGTRMGRLTARRPKPLIEVAGKALLDHALALAREVPCDPIVVNTHYLSDQIDAHLEGSEVQTSHEWPDILDTGGGLKFAAPKFSSGTVMTLNTDAVWRGSNPLERLLASWDPEKMDALLLVQKAEDALGHSQGDFSLDGGLLKRQGPWIYLGAQIIKLAPVTAMTDAAFSLNKVWDSLIAAGTLFGTDYDGTWCDVGRPENIPLAESMLHDL